MIKVLLFDLARVFLFPKNENYKGGLNDLYGKIGNGKKFKFEDYYYLDERQLNYVNTFKAKYKMYMFTSEFIQNDPAVRPKLESVFNRVFSAIDLGVSKKDKEAYELIAKILHFNPSEIWYTDDNQRNIEAAWDAGLKTAIYKSFEKLIEDLEELK